MPFSRVQFFGASLRGINSAISWNLGAPSSVTAQLVEDPENGDSFNPGLVGYPAFLTLGSFHFNGLLQKWERKKDTGGFPTYEVVLEDPRTILEGTQVILGGYNGPVGGVPNILSAFGYFENQAFGSSYASEAGMPWFRVRDAIIALTNQPNQTPYGGPLNYRGITYSVNLSELPEPPAHYRVAGGTSIGLLELIAQICEDGGCDFFVELQGYSIKIRTVSRRDQPSLGTISAITNANNGGTVVRSNNGLEARNETTSSFLVGGEVTALHITDSLASFWGYDINGVPILGASGRVNLMSKDYTVPLFLTVDANATSIRFKNDFKMPDGIKSWPDVPYYILVDSEVIKVTSAKRLVVGNDDVFLCDIQRGQFGTTAAAHREPTKAYLFWWSEICDFMNLNSSPISDILGSVIYPCSTFELRLAKVNYESWSAYMLAHKKDWADRIGLISPIRNAEVLKGGLQFGPDVKNDRKKNAQALNEKAVSGTLWSRQMRVYEFVKSYADEYLGKKWAVSLPFVLTKTDPETLRITTTYDITDGGYLPEGSAPLGLSTLNEDVFKTQDGRFRSFVEFSDLTSVDFSLVSPQGTVAENGVLFMESSPSPQIIATPAPAVVLTLASALFEEPADPIGDVRIVGAVLQQQPEVARKQLKQASFGNVSVKIHPAAKRPSVVAVPIKSNVLTYGPWSVAGAPGKVRFEQDASMVPWNYGGFSTMNLAGNARVAESVTNMNVSEAGALELAGPPLTSLGNVLQAGGPNVTNINVSYGTQGVTTTYSFQTYTPRFGVFSKGFTERMKRLSLADVEIRKSVRNSIKDDISRGQAIGNAARAAQAFLANAPKAVKRESPHDVFVGYSIKDAGYAGSGNVRVGVSTATLDEALSFCNADDDTEYGRTAVMSLQGLLHPFSTKESGGVEMSTYVEPASGFVVGLSKTNLDPFKDQHDTEIYAWGDSYEGLLGYHREGKVANSRLFGLRGPLVISGWGYDTEGYKTPDGWSPDSSGNSMLQRADTWKTGPVDLLWDKRRGVWTCHDVLKGKLDTDLSPLGSGKTQIFIDNSGTNWHLAVSNWGTDTLSSGSPVHCLFNSTDNKWYAANASSSSGAAASTLPSGVNYTVLHWNSFLGFTPNWSYYPNTLGYQLGAEEDVGQRYTHGFLSFFQKGFSSTASIDFDLASGNPAIPNSPHDTHWRFPGRRPQPGELLIVEQMLLPGSSDFSMLGVADTGRLTAKFKFWPHNYFGGPSGVPQDGYVALGTTGDVGYLKVKAGARSTDFDIVLPTGVASVGDVMLVSSASASQAVLRFGLPPSGAPGASGGVGPIGPTGADGQNGVGVSTGCPIWVSVTKTYSDLSRSGTIFSIPAYTLPVSGCFHYATVEVLERAQGGTISSYNIGVGLSGVTGQGPNSIIAFSEAKINRGTFYQPATNTLFPHVWSINSGVVVTLDASSVGGNLNTAVSGIFKVNLCLSVMV